MTLRTTAAVMAALTIGGFELGSGRRRHLTQDEWRYRHRDAVREIRDAVRETVRGVSHDTRHVVRDVVILLDVLDWLPGRDVMHEVQAAMGGDSSDDRDYERAERRREQDERRRDEAERRRERLEVRRDETARQRDARAFRHGEPDRRPVHRVARLATAAGPARCAIRVCRRQSARSPSTPRPTAASASRRGTRPTCWSAPSSRPTATTTPRPRRCCGRVQVTAAGTRVTAEGPERSDDSRRGGWSVSFRIWAPRQTALALTARNGGISLRGMHGESRFSTNNGGVTLDEVGGHVVGSTRNGGVNVRLGGSAMGGRRPRRRDDQRRRVDGDSVGLFGRTRDRHGERRLPDRSAAHGARAARSPGARHARQRRSAAQGHHHQRRRPAHPTLS